MKFAPFEHHFAESTEHAIALLGAYGDDAKVVAGGQSLFPMMALRLSRPDHLIDVGRLGDPSTAIATASDGSTVVTLACRHSAAESSAALSIRQPLVSAAMPWIGHRAVRSRGTLCGSLAHGDPAAELPAVALTMDAEMVLAGSGGNRNVAASEFFLGTYETAVQPDELLTEVRFPAMAPGAGWAFEEVSRRHGDYAVVGMAALVVCRLDAPHVIERASLAAFSVASVPIRFAAVEKLLVGEVVDPRLFEEAAEQVAKQLDPPADLHGTAEYRIHLGRLLTRRTLALAGERAITACRNADRKAFHGAHR